MTVQHLEQNVNLLSFLLESLVEDFRTTQDQDRKDGLYIQIEIAKQGRARAISKLEAFKVATCYHVEKTVYSHNVNPLEKLEDLIAGK